MDDLQEKVLSIVDSDIAEECRKFEDIAVGIPLNMHIARYVKILALNLSQKQGKGGDNCPGNGS